MQKRRRGMAAVALVLCGVAAAGACGRDETGTDSGDEAGDRVEVVASFYPLAEVASRVGRDRVEVTNLTPPGVEPHDIELSSDKVDLIEDADVVLYLGGGFQPAVETAAERREGTSVDVLAKVQGDGEADDPHFWLDPVLMGSAIEAVTDALVEASPADAELFRANAAAYTGEIGALDTAFQQGLANCGRREIVTSHDAFSYLAERYGLTQLAIAGLSPEAEPDADRLAELTDEVESKGITTIFYEDLVSPKVAETLAREAGVKTAVLSPLEGLTGEQLDAGKDYRAVMLDNLAALRQALACP